MERGRMYPRNSIRKNARLRAIAGVSMAAVIGMTQGTLATEALKQPGPISPEKLQTASPIKHIIYIVGENRSFDNIYATYQPKNGQKIWNLLSEGIVNADGTPGKNFALGRQFQATSSNGQFFLSPLSKTPYTFLPVPTISSAQPAGVGIEFGIVNAAGQPTAAFPQGDPEIPLVDKITLATGGTGTIPKNSADTRIPGVYQLPSGPFQQTSPTLPYDAYEGDTIHQLFQMWQQNDCSMKNATFNNPTGCAHDL